MKNYYKLFLLALLLVPKIVQAQCAFLDSPFGSAIAPTVNGTTVNMSTCNFYGEFSPVTGMLSANSYIFTIVAGGYITVFNNLNIAVAFGTSPLAFIPPADGTYKAQYNIDGVACGTSVGCQTTQVTLVGPSAACVGPAVAGTSSSTPVGACINQYISLSLAGVTVGSGLAFQWQSSTTGTIGSFVNVVGATNASLSTLQTVNTFYRCYVSCSGGPSDTSTVTTVNMNPFSSCYLPPSSTGGACINNVTLNTLNNTTAACQPGNYSAQAATTNLIVGATYPITVSTSGTAIVSVWIDYNQNGAFETTEWVQPFTNALTGTISLTIPATALAGNTGMRVRTRGGGSTNGAGDAQTAFFSGECEDYVVNLVIPNCPSVIGINQTAVTAFTSTIAWTVPVITPPAQWIIYWGTPGFTLNGAGQLGQQIVSAATHTITGLLPSTNYQARVRAICGALDTSFVSPSFAILTPATCPPPSLLSYTAGGVATNANLSWLPGGGESSWEISYGTPGFVINGAGELGSVVVGVNPSTVTGLLPNTFYQARIRAICTPGDTSFTSNVISFNTYGIGAFIVADNACVPFVSIATDPGATLLGLTDDSEIGYTLPFPFYYQGTPVTTMTIGNNGGILFNSLFAQVGYSIAGPAGIFPFTQDLATPGAGGAVGEGQYRLLTGTAPNRIFTVEWNVQHFFTSPSAVRFQAKLYEATGEIYFLYDDVDFGNAASYDNGLDAEIGITGAQNITISNNSTAYLLENSCVHFSYSNCPKPVNPFLGTGALAVTNNSATVFWSSGLSNETDWIVEYGPAGYTAGSAAAISTQNLSTLQIDIAGLSENTDYDVYIYASCVAVGDTSNALFFTFSTLPDCNNPAFAPINPVTSGPNTINANFSWSQTADAIMNFNVFYENVATGSVLTTFVDDAINNATITSPTLLGGAVYNVYVQAMCAGSMSDTVGPIQIFMPLTIDSICGAQLLAVDDVARTFHNQTAGVQAGENSLIVPVDGYNTNSGWGATGFFKTTWFKFVAPTSGNVRVNTTGIAYANKVAVWDIAACTSFTGGILKGANDDDEDSTSLGNESSNFVVCGLTPGSSYYIQHSQESLPFFPPAVPLLYSIQLKAINPIAGNALPLTSICYGDSIDLDSRLTGIVPGAATAVWSDNFNTGNISPTGVFTSLGNASTTYTFTYTLNEGCAKDTTKVRVAIVTRPNAGLDGTINNICKGAEINLINGINAGTTGGSFTNPFGVAVPAITSVPLFAGVYNYSYILTNPTCPSDTANIVVTVLAGCQLSISEQESEGFTVYPNPTDGVIFITNTSNDGAFSYEITNAAGSVVAFEKDAVVTETEINLSNNERGVYMVRIFNATTSKVIRIVKM